MHPPREYGGPRTTTRQEDNKYLMTPQRMQDRVEGGRDVAKDEIIWAPLRGPEETDGVLVSPRVGVGLSPRGNARLGGLFIRRG